ncbi:protein YIPF3 [Folsomia candida]|uniref:Protein YIPF3 n=1 Tax=Folsomia candida TaxID=158441 RepID=A0A226DN06_FOLCA|nr:protein YIPF3 [Folsomia candida]OXA46490.1 Protein YIPF3 [Folsomia candida]
MARTKKKDNSVVFIGEEDKEPLLKKGSNPKNSTPFPGSFIKYLFSEKSVLMRILSSLCPPFGRFKRIAVDYEGSFLSTFFLTAIVYWGLVTSTEHESPSRLFALLHATGLTVGYLGMISAFTWIISRCTKTAIMPRQIVCIMGYGLFGHAVVLLICEAGSDEWFMTLMTLLGGLGSFRICLILLARTAVPAGRFVLCCPVAIIHLLYLVYLHFVIMKR